MSCWHCATCPPPGQVSAVPSHSPRGGRWNAAPRHPGLAQPGVSHTQSLTSFSDHFIPLLTPCLLKSLLPTRRSTRPGFPGLPGECSHNWESCQSRELWVPPCRLWHPATHSRVKDPSIHLAVTDILRDKKTIRQCLGKGGFSFGVYK